jgi:hypothetical protein
VAVQAPPEQTSWAPVQAAGVSQSVQPDASFLQVATPSSEQRVAATVHWSLQAGGF